GALAPRGCRPDAPGAPGKPHCSAPGFGRRRARVHPRSQPRRGSRPPLRSSWARGIETARASSLLTADTVEVEARTNDHRGLSHIWEIDFFWFDAQLLVYVKKLCPTRSGPPEMKLPPFRYHDPKTVSEAVGLLGSLENAKLLAGGQSLMPMLNMRFVLPDHIIDLNRVEGLSYIREAKG